MICLSILIILSTLILDRLIPQGLFLDGITYAAISRNLAIGKGTFWELYYRNEWPFSSHPPLMFGLQALFFKLLGDHYIVEKLYSFVIWVLSIILIRQIWKSFRFEKYTYVLPVLLWCIIPTITWGYTNNILDCTMAMFDLAAVSLIIAAYERKASRYLINMFFAGLMVFAALFTKGPAGAFPATVPLIYWLCFRHKNKISLTTALGHSLHIVLVVTACYMVLYRIPAARVNLERYVNQQLVASLSGMKEVTGGTGRLTILLDLLMQLVVPAAIGIVLVIVAKAMKLKTGAFPVNKRIALLFILIGISASLPMMFSVKQRTFYLIPSLPYYAIAISAWVYPYFMALTERLKAPAKTVRVYVIVSAIVSIVLIGYLASKVGDVGRDKELITNIQLLNNEFPQGQVFGICPEMDYDYGFLAYLQRYNEMEVNPAFYTAEYLLIDKEVCNSHVTDIAKAIGYHEMPSDIPRYTYYKRSYPLHFDFMLLNPVFRRGDK